MDLGSGGFKRSLVAILAWQLCEREFSFPLALRVVQLASNVCFLKKV